MDSFKIIPAIDIIDGCCVRLTRGRYDRKTVYSHNPKTLAKQLLDNGIDLLHVVDLDGARTGFPVNISTIENIAATGINIELGGGLRSTGDIRTAIDGGVNEIILGSAIVNQLEDVQEWLKTFPGKLIAGIDAKDGQVAVNGWTSTVRISASDLVTKINKMSFKRIIYTDIARDGTLKGPNLHQLESISQIAEIPVIASGGVGSWQDVEDIRQFETLGVTGVIIGKAFFEGRITIEEMCQC